MTTVIFIGLILSTLGGTLAKCWLDRTIQRKVQTNNPIEMANYTQKIYRLTAAILGLPILTCLLFIIGTGYLTLFFGLLNPYTLKYVVSWVLYLVCYHYVSSLAIAFFSEKNKATMTSPEIIQDVVYTVKMDDE